MALTPEDIAALGQLIETKVATAVADVKADITAASSTPEVKNVETALEYYVHLADGNVVTLPAADASNSHVDGVAVIGKYQVGA
jgi:hypothetical protein